METMEHHTHPAPAGGPAGRGAEHTEHDHTMPGAHAEHAGHSEAMFARPFWVSLILTIPVLIYSELLQQLLGYTAPQFPGAAYLNIVLGSIIFWYGGWVFLTGAVAELRRRVPGMMTLVALAISTAYGYSVAATL